MGAGLSKQQRYRIVYNELHRIQRELIAACVLTTYSNRTLHGTGPKGEFTISYRTLNASNGESCMYPQASVTIDGKTTVYDQLPWMPGRSYEKDGEAAIIANFAN